MPVELQEVVVQRLQRHSISSSRFFTFESVAGIGSQNLLPVTGRGENELLTVVFTSGSTGRPKARSALYS